jgi:Protein of unknown function (DUF2510)
LSDYVHKMTQQGVVLRSTGFTIRAQRRVACPRNVGQSASVIREEDEPKLPSGWYTDPSAADRLRWWDGTQWTSIVRALDHRLRWTGTRWVGVSRFADVPKWMRCYSCVWAFLFGLWLPVTVWMHEGGASPRATIAWGLVLGGLSLIGTLVLGFALGRTRRWHDFGLAVAVGTVAMMLCYGVAMLSIPDPDNSNDIAAGAGIATFVVPTALVLAVVLGIGALLDRVIRRW